MVRTHIEKSIRQAIGRTLGHKLGAAHDDILFVIEHSSTLHVDGSSEESDTDMAVVIDRRGSAQDVFQAIDRVLQRHKLRRQAGPGAESVHMTMFYKDEWESRIADSHSGIARTINATGKVVFRRSS